MGDGDCGSTGLCLASAWPRQPTHCCCAALPTAACPRPTCPPQRPRARHSGQGTAVHQRLCARAGGHPAPGACEPLNCGGRGRQRPAEPAGVLGAARLVAVPRLERCCWTRSAALATRACACARLPANSSCLPAHTAAPPVALQCNSCRTTAGLTPPTCSTSCVRRTRPRTAAGATSALTSTQVQGAR